MNILGFRWNHFLSYHMNLDRETFENKVRDVVEQIPDRFRKRMKNVQITVENEPSREMLENQNLSSGQTLFGLYRGVPLTDRGHHTPMTPDRIFIFKRPIERAAENRKELDTIIEDTVLHEIAHFFGMDEKRVRTAEQDR